MDYSRRFAEDDHVARARDYQSVAKEYYDLVTDFYERGWGPSFHFAQRRRGESFRASLRRHQLFLARKLEVGPGDEVLDVGCGVGGPMGTIARSYGARVTGVNINAYQVGRARARAARSREAARLRVVEADFLDMPFSDGAFDAAYAIEATCHAPTKVSVFTEVARVLRPGGQFAAYEWCVTPRYDADDPEHVRVAATIERGNGLPKLATFDEVREGLDRAGFDLLEVADLATGVDDDTPWYDALAAQTLSLRALPRTPLGRVVTNLGLAALEKIGIAPAGAHGVSDLLNDAADALVAGGVTGIFTPMYFFRARKR